MKKAVIALTALSLTACVTPGQGQKKAQLLKYEVEPDHSTILQLAPTAIKHSLKDPDSLKNLHIIRSFKCYASKVEVTDNVSPKYDYGYWCFDIGFNATNSYGGHVRGSKILAYHQGKLDFYGFGDLVRKIDDFGTTTGISP